jgi:hypothetical protein
MRILKMLFVLVLSNTVVAQQSLNGDYRSMGMSGGYMFNIDDAALNTNPSLLGWQQNAYQHKLAVNFKGFTFASYSPLVSTAVSYLLKSPIDVEGNFDDNLVNLDNLSVLFEMMESYDVQLGDYVTYDTTVSRETRQDFKESLMASNSFKVSSTIFGLTYANEKHGVFSFKISTEQIGKGQISEELADLAAYGKSASYFDTLVLANGTHVANNSANQTNAILSQAYLGFSNDALNMVEIMNGSNVQFLKTRNYSIGWGKRFDFDPEDMKLFLGGNLNFIEGLNYYEIKNNNDEIIISNFGSSSTIKGPFGNCGYGNSLSLSATVSFKDKWMLSTGINNAGLIYWKAKPKNGGTGVFSNGIDNEEFANYNYGVSKTTFFEDQFEQSGFNWQAVDVDYGKGAIFRASPANYHLGVRRLFGDVFSVAGNVVGPINKKAVGSMYGPEFSLNYELTFKKFTLFSGLNNMNNTLSLPIGFSLGSRKSKFEIGLSVSDLLGYFYKNKTNNFSIGYGLKYRIK